MTIDREPPRLADLEFEDLYVSERGTSRMRARGNRGKLLPVPKSCREDVERFLEHITATAQEKRLGQFSCLYGGVNYRIQRIDSVGGTWWAARRVWQKPRDMEALGFARKLRDKIIDIGRSSGLILITGPTGAGKTTSAYGILYDLLLRTGGAAYCIEDPPEIPLDGAVGEAGWCFQVELKEDRWGDAIVEALRSHPTYLFLGEIRTREGARQALRAAVNGHLVIATLHAGNALESINAILALLDPDERREAMGMLADGLLMVLNQRMIGHGLQRRLDHQVLVAAGDFAIKAKIRAGTIEMLSTEVDAHTRRLTR